MIIAAAIRFFTKISLMLAIECTLISRAVRDFDIQIMKRALLVFGIASVTLCASFAQQSSGNSEGAAGTGSAGGSKAGPARSSEQGTQSQRETQNQQGPSTQSGTSNQGARSSASAPSTAGPAPTRTGSTEASPDGLRPAAPGISSGIRPAATPANGRKAKSDDSITSAHCDTYGNAER